MISFRLLIICSLLNLSTIPEAWACAVCGGASDSPMAQGMNWGIFSLLAVILPMLGAIAGFFIFMAKKAARLAARADSHQSLETKQI